MSKNYDNWERLVAAVLKRELFRQLCHQDSDSISTVASDSANTWRILQGPVALQDLDITDGLKFVRQIGKGEFATTHLAQLSQNVQQYSGMASRAIIKQMNRVNLTEDEFKEQMIVFGNCRHENVTTPRAYYYSYKRTLVVYDYYTQGSLFDMLKEKGSRLSWERRVKIAVGAARGIAHIHAQSLIHGNIKSSNIFINPQGYGCVSELGSAGMLKRTSLNEKDDVYSFGLLLLQLGTGDCPIHMSVINMSVRSVHRELEKMLQVAKRCLHRLRPSMSDVVLMVENIAGLRTRHALPPLGNRLFRFGI